MDHKLDIQKSSKSKKLSIFFKQASIEEDRAFYEIDNPQDSKSNSKCLFQIRHCQPQKLHQGDQDLSCRSFQTGFNDYLQESQKDINTIYQSVCKSPQGESVQISFNHFLNQNQKNSQAQTQTQQTQEQDITAILPMNGSDTLIEHQQAEGQRKSNVIDTNNQNFHEQSQSNYFLSKNTIIKSETQNKPSIDGSQCKSINKSRQKINSHILIQDDIFYEKDLKKLGTKVNFALKSQYQLQQEFNNSSTYKQNLQKAAKIVSRLLNSSMNRVMRIRYYVNNFITILKLRHQNRKIECLSHQEFLSINDLSYFHQQKRKTQQIQVIMRSLFYILKFAKFFPTFMPSNTLRVIWDMLLVTITYIFLYIYSLLIFFDQNCFQPQFMQKFNLAVFTLFLVDILVNLNTAFYEKDTIITKRMLIARKYFFSSIFVTDFISMFMIGSKIIYPNQLIIYDLNQSALIFGFNILIFLKANGISSKKKRFDYVFTLTENQKHICKLINQLSTVITVAHLAGIGWYFVGIQEANNNNINWLEKINIQSKSIYEKYVYSIYWSITTMTTDLNDDLSTIQRYLIRKNVSIQLKSRVRHYLAFLSQVQKDRDKLQEDKILGQLSNKLRDEITLEINSKILNNYHLFSSNFSISTLNKLIFIMEEILVNPNEIIFSEDEYDDQSIYFIQNGIIEIYQQQIQKQGQINIIKTLKDGQIFGDISFFSGLQRQSSARSVNLSTLYKIKRDDFIEILKENKEDFERFKMMEDQIIFQKEKSVIHNECYYCKESSHIANQCPRSHKLFDKQFVILKHNFSMFQERSRKEKINKLTKSNTMKNLKQYQDRIQLLKQTLQTQIGESFFLLQENSLSSQYSMSQYENDEDDENTQSQFPNNSEDKDLNQKRSIKVQDKERIDKSSKSMLKTEKSYQAANEEIEFQINQENQIQRCHSNLVYENQDAHQAIYNTSGSQARLKSFDATDSIDSENQEQLNNILTRQKSQQESSKIYHKKDADSFQTKKHEQLLNEKDGSNINISSKFGIQKSHQQNAISTNNNQQVDLQKNQIKKCLNQSQLQEDQIQNQNQENCQIQQISRLEGNKKASFSFNTPTRSKKNSIQKSQKHINQSKKEPRCSVEQSIQNIAAMMLLQNKNISSQQINTVNYKNQDSSGKFSGSSLSIKDHKENNQTSQKSNRLSYNKNSFKENSLNKLQTQQLNETNKKQVLNNELQIIERLSKILQNSQLPLLLQLTNGKSFLNLDSQFQSNIMDQFDRMQCFKKFYPDYNFDKVLLKLKSSQQEQKKLKKVKLATKERRQNIGLTKISVFQANSNIFRIIAQDYDINQYKPTYLSYGIKMKKGIVYPINNYYLQNI
ncbi:hypothetical protein ABPG72_021243 [Tetrahymena utriculariae]